MKLELIDIKREAKNTMSFFLKKPKGFIFKPGQYLVFKIDEEERQFTIASSPSEEFIQITVRIRKESLFKQSLYNLKIGSEVEAHGPFGSFVLTKPYALVPNHLFLVGGIGITPFRSMIKHNIDQKLGIPMFLIYSNSDSEFVFKEELDTWQKANDFIKIEYVNTSVVGRIDQLKIEKLIGNWKLEIGNCAFSAVGPKAFVNSMEDILEEMKIPEDQIKTEKFIGY